MGEGESMWGLIHGGHRTLTRGQRRHRSGTIKLLVGLRKCAQAVHKYLSLIGVVSREKSKSHFNCQFQDRSPLAGKKRVPVKNLR